MLAAASRAATGREIELGHLLIRAPNWVGDLVMATALLEAAVAEQRFERVTIAVRAHLAALLSGGPGQAHVRSLARDASEAEVYRELAPDGVLLLTNSLGAA